jgi:putative hemolysin
MSTILVELVVILSLVVINGLLALSELAVVSARRTRLQDWANAERSGAQAALDLAESPNRFLSTVQIGITAVGVLAGAFGGATLASVLSTAISQIAPLESYADPLGLGLVVVGITYLSVVIGELVPKRIALQNPERTAVLVAAPMRVLSLIAAPVVTLLTRSGDLVMRVLGIAPGDEPPVTEDEIRILLAEGTHAGVIRREEQAVVENVFKLDNRHVGEVMTPHTEVVWLDAGDPPETVREKVLSSSHARYPVVRGSLDRLLGVVHVETLLARLLAGDPLALDEAVRPPRFVPENARVWTVLDLLKRSQEHLLFAVNEHGGIEGVVTGHDLLQAIVGHIPTPQHPTSAGAVQLADNVWLLNGMIAIDDFKALFDLDEDLPDEARAGYTTLGGFVLHMIGDVPATGECFAWRDFQFEVTAMDGLRVAQVIARHLPARRDTRGADDESAPCA